MPTILVVDDELSMREFLKILLEKEGYKVFTASEASSAIDLIRGQKFDLVLSDIKMPGMGGLSLLERIKELKAPILTTNFDDLIPNSFSLPLLFKYYCCNP